VWAISCIRGTNDVALGYDEGCIVVKLGREEPAVSMDGSGKVIWARHNEIQTVNTNYRTSSGKSLIDIFRKLSKVSNHKK